MKTENKTFGTIETIGVLLQHRPIMSEIIRQMDVQGVGYISELFIHRLVSGKLPLVKPDAKKRLKIAFSLNNLTQANVVVNVDYYKGENRLFFHEAVLGVIRLCDVSLTQQLTDAQLRTQLNIMSCIEKDLSTGMLTFEEGDPDYAEAIDNLFIQLGNLFSLVKQNTLKMEQMSKELETLTSSGISSDVSAEGYIKAKEDWLDHILKMYERHIMPTLTFLSPDTRYSDSVGLYLLLESISTTLKANGKEQLSDNIDKYTLSFLNMYKPIESVALTVNRFIHKERESILRFNAYEYFYQNVLLKALAETQSERLNRTQLSREAIIIDGYIKSLRVFQRPKGYLFNSSIAYFNNIFNELESRTKDIFAISDALKALSMASKNDAAKQRLEKHKAIKALLEKLTLRETDDLTVVFHERLSPHIEDYRLSDLISAMRIARLSSDNQRFHLKTVNHFATLESDSRQYVYRQVRCIKRDERDASP